MLPSRLEMLLLLLSIQGLLVAFYRVTQNWRYSSGTPLGVRTR